MPSNRLRREDTIAHERRVTLRPPSRDPYRHRTQVDRVLIPPCAWRARQVGLGRQHSLQEPHAGRSDPVLVGLARRKVGCQMANRRASPHGAGARAFRDPARRPLTRRPDHPRHPRSDPRRPNTDDRLEDEDGRRSIREILHAAEIRSTAARPRRPRPWHVRPPRGSQICF